MMIIGDLNIDISGHFCSNQFLDEIESLQFFASHYLPFPPKLQGEMKHASFMFI